MIFSEKKRFILDCAQRVIDGANWMGVVLTIELQPQEPLSSGNYKMVAEVRPARVDGNYEEVSK